MLPPEVMGMDCGIMRRGIGVVLFPKIVIPILQPTVHFHVHGLEVFLYFSQPRPVIHLDEQLGALLCDRHLGPHFSTACFFSKTARQEPMRKSSPEHNDIRDALISL